MRAMDGMGGSALAEARPAQLSVERLCRPLAEADALLWRLLVALVHVVLDGLAEYAHGNCRTPGHSGPPHWRDEEPRPPSASDPS